MLNDTFSFLLALSLGASISLACIRLIGRTGMEETIIAMAINAVFAGFDQTILSIMHEWALGGGAFLTPFFSLISFIGEKGLLLFVVALALMLFRKTRKVGICVFVAVCIGALITNIILKDIVARPRPFEELALYHSWWQFVGAPEETGYSFPSGHVTAASAGVLALVVSAEKPIAWEPCRMWRLWHCRAYTLSFITQPM